MMWNSHSIYLLKYLLPSTPRTFLYVVSNFLTLALSLVYNYSPTVILVQNRKYFVSYRRILDFSCVWLQAFEYISLNIYNEVCSTSIKTNSQNFGIFSVFSEMSFFQTYFQYIYSIMHKTSLISFERINYLTFSDHSLSRFSAKFKLQQQG